MPSSRPYVSMATAMVELTSWPASRATLLQLSAVSDAVLSAAVRT